MKKAVFSFSIIPPVLVGCRSSPQPTGTIPPSASTPSPTETTIPQGPDWIVYNTANSGLPDDRVFALAIDEQGNKWIGTGDPHGLGGGGLVEFNGETWTVYDTANSGLPNNKVFPIVIDNQGSIWIGTNGGGLPPGWGEVTPKAWAQDGAGRCCRSCTTFFQLELTGLLRVKFKSGDVLQVVS